MASAGSKIGCYNISGITQFTGSRKIFSFVSLRIFLSSASALDTVETERHKWLAISLIVTRFIWLVIIKCYFKTVSGFKSHSHEEEFSRESHKLKKRHSGLCDWWDPVRFTGKTIHEYEKNWLQSILHMIQVKFSLQWVSMTENNESHPAPFKSLLGKDNTKNILLQLNCILFSTNF